MCRKQIITLGLAMLASLTAVVLLSPLIALVNPFWIRHVYSEISFQLIAQTKLSASSEPDAIVQSAVDYTRRHLWIFEDSRPYAGHPFDYLVEGVGWCDYYAKVFCQLLAARGLHARYDFLKDESGVSPHTIAEVYVDGKWRALDPFFNLNYMDETGERATLQAMTPDRVNELPEVLTLEHVNEPLYRNIMEVAKRTFPLPRAPQRSDDFLADKHLEFKSLAQHEYPGVSQEKGVAQDAELHETHPRRARGD